MKVRKANRLQDYDYSQNGFYFLTICVKNRQKCFGKAINEDMILSDCGEIAEKLWLEIPIHFENVKLDEHIIMPNHVHGIVILDNDDVGNAYMRSLPYDRSKMKLSKIVQQYKAAVTRKINQMHNEFSWQKSFYDHIIRNDKSLHRIRKYIHYNPLKWEYDQENQNEISSKQKKKFWKNFLQNLETELI